MVASVRQTLARRVEEIERALARPRFLHLRPEILVHAPASDGAPCPCCSSQHTSIIERQQLAEVIIDAANGRRFFRGDLPTTVWTVVEAESTRFDVPLRCSQAQLPLLLNEDDDRHILASGGNRSGKTYCGMVWLALQWLRRGGPGRRFWLVGATVAKAFGLLDKLFTGDPPTPPVLPPELVITRPDSPRCSSLLTILADGSILDLKHFGGPGAETLKSDKIVAGLVTEAAHLPAPDSLAALKGRCVDLDGRLFLDSTPRPEVFLKAAVVDQAEAFARLPTDDPKRIAGEHPGARWRVVPFELTANPWLDPAVLARELAALDPEDPATLRDWKGLWVANSGMLWRDFNSEAHVHLDEARSVADMPRTVLERTGLRVADVTSTIARRIFGARPNPHYRGLRASNLRYILASDVNCHPMSTVMLQVTADPTCVEQRDRWHVWVMDVEQSRHSNALVHAERLVDLRWVRQWLPTATVSPYKGCGMVVDPQALHRDPTAHKHGRDPHGLAETWGNLGFDARAPQYRQGEGGLKPTHLGRRDSHLLLHRLLRERRLHLSQRCGPLVQSFVEQLDAGDGIEPLTRSHTKSDQLASPMDALRYGVWAIFHGGHDAIAAVV